MSTRSYAAILLTSLALICVPGSASAEPIDAAAGTLECTHSATTGITQTAQPIACIMDSPPPLPCIWIDLTKSPPTITTSLNCV